MTSGKVTFTVVPVPGACNSILPPKSRTRSLMPPKPTPTSVPEVMNFSIWSRDMPLP